MLPLLRVGSKVKWWRRAKVVSNSHLQPTAQGGVSLAPRLKRRKNYWDPIFDPDDADPFTLVDWDLSGTSKFYHKTLDSRHLSSKNEVLGRTFARQTEFICCDFQGDFKNSRIIFSKCSFTKCDFGSSYWSRARFKDCMFDRCSFSLAELENCEFRDCKFSETGLSGNEMVLNGTAFNNPKHFIESGFTAIDPRITSPSDRGKAIAYQRMRLEETKSTVARTIMASLSTVGDENSFYEAVENYQRLSLRAKRLRVLYRLSLKPVFHQTLADYARLLVLVCEAFIVQGAGKINRSGASVARPAIAGGVLITIFSAYYWFSCAQPNLVDSIEAAIDITLLVGYTKIVSNSTEEHLRHVYQINMLFGLAWYSVFIPTVIGRISRVR